MIINASIPLRGVSYVQLYILLSQKCNVKREVLVTKTENSANLPLLSLLTKAQYRKIELR